MGWPADLPLRTCSLGPDFGLVTGTDYGVDITVSVSRPFMTWGSTGAGAVGDGETISINPGVEQTFQLPVTDAAGWYVGGVPVDVTGGKQSHVYNLTIKPWTQSSSGRKTYLATTVTLAGLAVPSGTGTLDLDKAAAMPSATGGTVTVPDYVAQLEDVVNAAEADLAAVAAAPTDAFVAARVADSSSATAGALDARYARRDITYFGATGDGSSHPLSGKYASLAAAQVDYPSAQSLTDEIALVAIEKSIATYGGFLLPETGGSFCINNRPIDLTGSGRFAIGPGYGKATITQATGNVEIVKVGNGGGLTLRGMTLAYTSQQPSASTNAIGLSINDLWNVSSVERLKVALANTGIKQVGGACFSTSFKEIEVVGWSVSAIDLTNAGGGNTGNVLENVYVHNNYNGTAATATAAAIKIGGWHDGILNQVNTEWVNCPVAIDLANVKSLSIKAWHVEGFAMTGAFSGVLRLVNTFDQCTVDGWTIENSQFLTANGVTNCAFVALADSCRVLVNNLFEATNNTVTATASAVFKSGSGAPSASVYFTNSSFAGDFPTIANGAGADQFPVIKQVNEQRFHWRDSSKHRITGSAIPTTGTWAVGDQIINTAPTVGSPRGWVCVIAGSPGTWEALAPLSAAALGVPLVANMYYPPIATNATTYLFGSDGTGRAGVTVVGRDGTLKKIGLEVTTAGSTGSVIRLGLYLLDPTTGTASLLVDAGTIDGTSATYQELTISVPVKAGDILLPFAASQGGATTQPTVRGSTAGWNPFTTGNATATVASQNASLGTNVGSITGALPTTHTLSSTTTIPRVLLRA